MNEMNQDKPVPRPRARSLRAWLRISRSVRPFYRPISIEDVLAHAPSPDEVAHWGRIELLDDNLVVLHPDGTVTFRNHYIAILHGDQDLREWEEIGVAYRRVERKPKVIRSVLHLPDGSRQKGKIVDRPIDAAGNRAIVCTHAHLRPGVIADHEIQDDFFTRSDIAPGVWGDFYLRTRWPCVRRRLTIAVGDPFTLNIALHHGATAGSESRVGRYKVHQWDVANTPGIELDALTPPAADVCAVVDYSTLPSWQPLVDHFRKELDPDCVSGHRSWDDTHKVIGDAKTARQKVEKVYQFAASDVRYGRPLREMDERLIRTGSRIAEDLQGDCKDKSALMAAMLRKVGVPVDIVVLRTRIGGTRTMLPGPRFDHAIAVAHVDGQDIWLDAAADGFTMGVLPYQVQGAQALLLGRDGDARSLRVPLADPSQHGIRRACRGQITEDGTYRFTATTECLGERAAELRAHLRDRSPDFRRRTLQIIEGGLVRGATVEDVSVTGVDDLLGNLVVTCKLVIPEFARAINALMLLRIPWADALELAGALTEQARNVPLMPPSPALVTETHVIDLPPGYNAYGLPFQSEQRCDWSSYRCEVRQEGTTIHASRRLEHAAGESVVPPEKYPIFRSYWASCARADAQDVVLFKGERAF